MAGATEVVDRGLRFAMLGPLQVTRSGDRLTLGGRQQRAVLAVLLADAGAVVSVGRIADALWGEHTPSGFVTTVQTYVFHLREVLEPGRPHGAPSKVLVTESGSGYRLDTGGSTVDSATFESSLRAGREAMGRRAYDVASAELSRGLGLWRGEVLADLADLPFVVPIAARLQDMRLIAQGLRIEAELALGRHAESLPEIDRLVAEHPLWEHFHAQLITALYRNGRQSDALSAYRDLRRRLDEELGIEPSPPLQQLHRAVLAQAPDLDWQPPPTTARRSTVLDTGTVLGTGTTPGTGLDVMRSPPPEPTSPPRTPVGPGWAPRGRRRTLLGTALPAVLVAASLSTLLVARWINPSPSSFPGNSVGSISDDGTLGESLPVGLSPDGLAFGDGSVWAANRTDGTVSRIDPGTLKVVQTITVGTSPTALTVIGHDVWVANFGDGTVSRISTKTNTLVDRVVVGNQPIAIASGKSGVWVANSGDDTIQRIDPVTGLPDKAVGVGDGPVGIAVDKAALWVSNGIDGTVLEIDPVSLQQGAPVLVGGGPQGIALSGTDVWVASHLSQSVTRINRTTGAALPIAVGDGPHSVQVTDGAVWVSNEYDATISRIDQSTNEVRTVNIGASPRGLAAAPSGGSVWVASGAFADPAHFGGTMKVAGAAIPGGPDGIDPAAVHDSITLSAQRFVYDGLVAFALSGEPAARLLVPDLAVAIPRASNGNKTYAFTLKPDIRYSTGREVRATDFVTGVRKALTVGGSPEFFAGIVGGRNCIDQPASCDLSAGLITDDATGRVTFNLTAPDPLFLYKLTFSVRPVPPRTPATLSSTPVPGTGPYMISKYVPKKEFTLVRNPYFRQWSFAAQPAGYADVIDYRTLQEGEVAADEVNAGRADVAEVEGTDAVRDDLQRRYPDRFKTQGASTEFDVINTRLAPFDDVRVRRALNYAVDRDRLAAIVDGSYAAQPTCQVLPPNFPSHRWYCPYTTGPPDGQYHGPDLAKAKDLVERSGTRGMAVSVQGADDARAHEVNIYLVSVLRQLGFTVKLQEHPRGYDFVGSLGKVHITFAAGAYSGYPDAATFFDSILSCGTTTAAAVNPSARRGWYCNPQVERAMAEAHAMDLSDPGKAGGLWAEVDRLITDDAAFVALGNGSSSTLVSERVGNYQSNSTVGPLLSQIWVKSAP